MKRFNGESIDTISPTLGFNIKTLEHKGYTLNMWDVGGQKSLRSYWRNYFECTDGLIWVVDSADRLRLDTCRQELEILLQEERLAGATLLVLANKQDLPGSLTSNEIKDVSEQVVDDFPSFQMFQFSSIINYRFYNWRILPLIIGLSWESVQSPERNYFRLLIG